MYARGAARPQKGIKECPETPCACTQGSDRPVEAPVSQPLPKSPFQKPSVQIISLSDDGSEAPTTVRHPIHTETSSTPVPQLDYAHALHVRRAGMCEQSLNRACDVICWER